MNNRIVAQNWRQQTNKAHNGSHMYYEGKTIFSYGSHFPMAYITGLNFGGKDIVLQNSYGYSNSTNRHVSHMKAQCYDDAVIAVPTDILKNLISEFEYRHAPMPVTLEKAQEAIKVRIEYSTQKRDRAYLRKESWQYQIDKDTKQLEVIRSL